MTEPVEQKAEALRDVVYAERGLTRDHPVSLNRKARATDEALCRAIEAHERTLAEFAEYQKKVSDQIIQFCGGRKLAESSILLRCFILPEPVDPLLTVLRDMGIGAPFADVTQKQADCLREAIAKHGGKIIFPENGDG